MTTSADDALLIHEPFETYLAKAQHYLTSHQLADFRKCPLLYHRKRLGLTADQERPAYLVGRAAHALILEGRQHFDDQYAVGGPINPRTGSVYGSNTKAFAKWAKAQGKPVLTREQFDLVLRMHLGVTEHEMAMQLLAEGVPEGVVRADYCGASCQIRIDWLNPQKGIVDLKTCDDLTWFEADARRFGYVHQLAFYRMVLADHISIFRERHKVRETICRNSGLPLPSRVGLPCPDRLLSVHLIAVEKKEPHRCGVWKVDPQAIDGAQRENEAAIERLKRCEATSVWPSGYEELRVFDSV